VHSEIQNVENRPFSLTGKNPLVEALGQKRAEYGDFSFLPVEQVADIAANADGRYPREQSWLAVEHLCCQALAKALGTVDIFSDIAQVH
jgi:hypothetical protein